MIEGSSVNKFYLTIVLYTVEARRRAECAQLQSPYSYYALLDLSDRLKVLALRSVSYLDFNFVSKQGNGRIASPS